MNNPNRNEVWLVDLGLAAKIRPCLIINIPILDQDRALSSIIPHTTSIRNSRFEVNIKLRFLKPGAFDVQNIITIPNSKLIRKLGALTIDQMDEINTMIKFWLGL